MKKHVGLMVISPHSSLSRSEVGGFLCLWHCRGDIISDFWATVLRTSAPRARRAAEAERAASVIYRLLPPEGERRQFLRAQTAPLFIRITSQIKWERPEHNSEATWELPRVTLVTSDRVSRGSILGEQW